MLLPHHFRDAGSHSDGSGGTDSADLQATALLWPTLAGQKSAVAARFRLPSQAEQMKKAQENVKKLKWAQEELRIHPKDPVK